MSFGKLLKKLTKEKGLTYKELAKRCNENTNEKFITEGYIKEIANERKNPPTEEKIREIAKALDVDEKLLVLEGYIDKAPKEIRDILNKIKEYVIIAGLTGIENTVKKDEYELIKQEFKKESISQYVLDFFEKSTIEYISNKDFKININGLKISVNINAISFIEILDNSMSPKINKGDKITIYACSDNKYINGEIVAAKIKGTNEILYRIIHFNNKEKTVSFTPINTKEFKEITYNREDIEIIGKVAKVITDL